MQALLEKMGLSKDELVQQYCQGRTTHVSELSFAEAVELNTYLYSLLQQAPADPREKQRRRVIAHLRGAGFERVKLTATNRIIIADMPRINQWVETNFKADLNSLSTQQLSQVIVAAGNVEKSYKKQLSHDPRSN